MYCRKLPLYDNLASKCETSIDDERVKGILNELDPARSKQIVILLVHNYFLKNPKVNPFKPENNVTKSRNSINNLPYDIKISSSGIGLSFDYDHIDVPTKLLSAYCGSGI